MPVIKSAIKRLRQISKRTDRNRKQKNALKEIIHGFRLHPNQKELPKVFAKLDKAVKTNLIHKNKAARLKSRLAKKLSK